MPPGRDLLVAVEVEDGVGDGAWERFEDEDVISDEGAGRPMPAALWPIDGSWSEMASESPARVQWQPEVEANPRHDDRVPGSPLAV